MQIYLWTLSFLKPYKGLLTLFIVCGLIAACCELALPKFIQYFIDHIVPEKKVRLFGWLLVGISVLLGIMFGVNAAQNLLQRIVREKAGRDLQYALFQHLRKLGFAYYEQKPVGETLSLFNTETAAVQDIYRHYFPRIIQKSLLLLVSTGFLLSLSLRLSLIIIPAFLSYYLLGPYFERRAARYAKQSQVLRMEHNKKTYDSMSSLLELRAHGRQAWDLRRFVHSQEEVHKISLKHILNAYLRGTVRRLTVNFGAVFVFIFGAMLIQSGAMTKGELIAFIFYYFVVMGDLTMIITLTTEQRMLMFQAEQLYQFMKEEPLVTEKAQPTQLGPIRGELAFRGVAFQYPGHPLLLKGMDLHVQAGERVALVGTSGNGKSTLLKLVCRFYDPTVGVITLDGVPLTQLPLSQLRESIGYVFQETYLFGTSVRENIRFGRPQATDAEVEAAAKAAYAHDFIEQLPEGYATYVGERGIKLSGGQRQRIAIARMFVKNPAIVLLDEATSALDNVSEAEVQRALDALLVGRTTLTVAHRLTTIKDYDRIIVIDEGRQVESGKYEELLLQRGAFYRLQEGVQHAYE